jgi:hypothetical protein
MRTRIKCKFSLLFVAFAALLAVPAIALADNISNTLDPTVDAVAETMPLTVGGANGTTKLYVDPTNGDGKPGCNLTGSTSLVISLASSNTGVATVSPSNVTFTSCLTSANGIPITVTPHNQGTATISAALVSNTTAGTFNLDPVKFTVNVAPPPNTPPQVTVAGVTGGASFNKGSVPHATCQVTDAEDGNSSFAATLSPITGPFASDGIGSQTASCSYTDAGGATAAASLSYSIVDPSPPVITKLVTGTDGDNDWYTSNVKVDWTVVENESPNSLQKTGCVDQNIIADQAATTYSCSATSAGGSAGPVNVTIKRDATPPTNVSLVGGGISNNASYDFGDVPAAPTGCTADDATSGLAGPCDVTGYSTAVGNHTLTATATDNAGNVATATRSYTVKAWRLSGFYQPVDMDTATQEAVNTVKGGSTVPLKFEVFKASGPEFTDTAVVDTFTVKGVTCPATGFITDDIELTTTGGTSLRYDATAGQFIQNWQTTKKPGACYDVTMQTDDGSKLLAHFQLK